VGQVFQGRRGYHLNNAYGHDGLKRSIQGSYKSLDVILDSRLNLDSHVRAVCKSCRYHTWALRHIRHFISEESSQTLACSIAMSRLDYCNSLLYGMPEYVLNKYQSVSVEHTVPCAQQTSECAKYTGTSGHKIRCTDFSSTSSSETPLVADPPKNLVQTGNADFQSPNYFHTKIHVESTLRSQKYWLLASVNRSPTVDRAKNKNINCKTAFLLCRTFSLEHIA